MKIQQTVTKILSSILAAVLCLTPEMMSAAAPQNSQPPAQGQQQNDQQNVAPAAPSNSQSGPQVGQTRGTTVDPSQGPLQPVTTYPDAPTPQQDEKQNASQPAPVTTTTEPAAQTQKPVTEPVGAAAAEKVPTAGGAASKPAGAAIAPAKQHQTRSLFLKIGAIAAGGLAAGSVYALSHGTSSKPPGAATAGAMQK
ncbi:MAG TPA: hypothetical protein VKY85_18095 [Candidatus Angelobacter sp.]|nr:hypothetical protein [Candidatus Angelobacter sp.]